MSKMAQLHADILDGDAEALQMALEITRESAQPKEIYLLMDGQQVLHAYADKQLALMEAHFMTDAAGIEAGRNGDVPNDDFWVKTIPLDYTPFDWLEDFEREQDASANVDKIVPPDKVTVNDGRVAPTVDDAIETFRKARKIAPHAGIVKSTLRLFDELVKCDKDGVLKGVREAVEGNVER